MADSSKGAPPPPAATAGVVSRWIRWTGNTLRNSLAVVGVAAVAVGYYEYQILYPASKESSDDKSGKAGETKKKILVVPFNRLQLVDRKQNDPSKFFSRFGRDKTDRSVDVELRELVDLIHQAASDPEISALYGIFGQGSMIPQMGFADLEELRTALRVFRESHRRHPEPNLDYQIQVIPRTASKPLYAYTDTFASFGDSGNKEYYLASIFTHIHMQKNGELNLFGLMSQQFFFRGFLQKYGINLHVFKHGQYKNSPNTFTESKLNRPHRENVTNILQHLDELIAEEIIRSRSKALLTTWMKRGLPSDVWKQVHESGTFPAVTAWKSGLVDYLPRRDPLPDLIDSNTANSKVSKAAFKAEWNHQETDFDRFPANDTITLMEYSKKNRAAEKAEKRKAYLAKMKDRWHQMISGNKAPGTDDPEKREDKEEIALLTVSGPIGDQTARKVVDSLRKIRKSEATKALVVRVSSPGGSLFACETILQELKALKVPVVFSFGNVAASGGYYIASGANRIFASNKTVTGSIGVYAVRADLTGLAAKYGINVEHIAAGDLAATFAPFVPMTRKMKLNLAASVDRYYDQFKGVVAEGRRMSLDKVEDIAQGRVFTGNQAKMIGLVDELGGLHRALSYAERTYTGGDAKVVVWPKESTMWEKIVEAGQSRDFSNVWQDVQYLLWGPTTQNQQSNAQGDVKNEASAADFVDWFIRSSGKAVVPGSITGILLSSDENTAIQLVLEDAMATKVDPLQWDP